MNGIFDCITAVSSAQRARCVDLGLDRVSRSDQIVPLLDGAISNDLHASAHITGQVLISLGCTWASAKEAASCAV